VLCFYVSAQALKENPAVEGFVNFYLESVNQFFEQVQYVPLPDGTVQEARERFNDRVTGTPHLKTPSEKRPRGRARRNRRNRRLPLAGL
jgi:hypothetical protein